AEARGPRECPLDSGVAAAYGEAKHHGIAADLFDVGPAHPRNGAEHELDVGVSVETGHSFDPHIRLPRRASSGGTRRRREQVDGVLDACGEGTAPGLTGEIRV